MPKITPNYQNNLIYKIQHKTIDGLIYIGSTTNFTQRKSKHKSNSCNENTKQYNQPKYKIIRENGGWDMFNMVLVKKYPCNDHLEAFAEEEKIMREMNANMNHKRCFLSKEEQEEYRKQYYETHKEEIKQYRETHKEESKEYGKQYRETHREYFKQYSKQYYETHREKQLEKQKQYRETHREKQNQKVECECGCFIARCNLTKHKKSQKHLKLISQKN